MVIKRTYISALLGILFSLVIGKNTYALDLDYIVGKNRYETASLIASKLSYDKAIIVNGMSLVDGLAASGLSGAISGPILLAQVNSIPQTTINSLKGVKTVYIVGGTGVVSKEVENKIKSMGISVKRVAGPNRFSTSIAVANEINSIKSITELYYVNGMTGQADAMSIAPVAAKSGNPVILTNGNNTDYRLDVISYSVGGTGVMGAWFDSFTERLSGANRFLTNKVVINKFFSEKDHVYLSKSDELIDSLTSSALKKPVVLINNYSDKSVIAGAKSATVIGNVNANAVSQAKSYIYGDAVVFYSQHQDDETLFAGSAIVDAIASVGKENVYIVLVTDGTQTAVFNNPRYINLTREEKATLRNNEFIAACTKLGIDPNNIRFLNEPDENCKFGNLSATVLDFEKRYDNVTHVAHSYIYDINVQHMQSGKIIYDLFKQGLIDDVRFFARRDQGYKIPLEYLIEAVSDNEEERKKVVQAIDEYRTDNGDMVREAVAFKSVESLFRVLLDSPKVNSYLHEPIQ